MIKNTTPAVDAIGGLQFAGNIIPDGWYQNNLLKNDNGKLNLNAVIILAEIVYWYRPTIIRDEASGLISEVNKRFKSDKLQKSYSDLANKFGLTKRQAQDACHFLHDKGIITIELRNIQSAGGGQLFNLVYIEPNPEMIKTLNDLEFADAYPVGWYVTPKRAIEGGTVLGQNATPPTPERATSHVPAGDLPRSSGGPPTPERDTCTKTTPKTTPQTTTGFLFSQSSNDLVDDNDIGIQEEEDRNKEDIIAQPVSVKNENQNEVDRVLDKVESTSMVKQSETGLLSGPERLKVAVNNFNIYRDNSFLVHFGKHSKMLFAVLNNRIERGWFSFSDVLNAFSKMEDQSDLSIMDLLASLENVRFTKHHILMAFVEIMLDGKLGNFAEQGKAAKVLTKWIDSGISTLSDIEDCFLWLPDSGRSYRLGLSAIQAAASEFDRVKVLQPNGRYVGGSLTEMQPRSKEEKTTAVLGNRNYDEISKNVAERIMAKRKAALESRKR